ncbi:MAG: hypothetical protein QW734_11570 [Candidatus Bathyarchaeia archaeon]
MSRVFYDVGHALEKGIGKGEGGTSDTLHKEGGGYEELASTRTRHELEDQPRTSTTHGRKPTNTTNGKERSTGGKQPNQQGTKASGVQRTARPRTQGKNKKARDQRTRTAHATRTGRTANRRRTPSTRASTSTNRASTNTTEESQLHHATPSFRFLHTYIIFRPSIFVK